MLALLAAGYVRFFNTSILDFLYILRAGERVYLPSLTDKEGNEETTRGYHVCAHTKGALDVMLQH